MLISIIMPVYNVEKYLHRSISSIINQKYENWELVIIDDGSTDDSLKICREFESMDRRIKVKTQKNSGSGVARSIALEISKGRYVYFIDSDDYVDPKLLYDNINIIKKYNPDMLINGYKEIRKDFKKNSFKIFKPILEGYYEKEFIRENFSKFERIGSRALWNKFYNRQFLNKYNIDFTKQRIGQDALFNYSAYTHLSSIYINKKTYYYYDSTRENSAVKSYKPNRFEYEKNIARQYNKMYESWDREKIYKENISYSYWKSIITEFVNINYKNSPYTFFLKKKRIKELYDDVNLNEKISNLEKSFFKSTFERTLFSLYKKRSTNRITILIIMYLVYRNKY